MNEKLEKKSHSTLRIFWKPEACSKTVLPDRSLFNRKKLVENAKIKESKCDILSHFQTICTIGKVVKMRLFSNLQTLWQCSFYKIARQQSTKTLTVFMPFNILKRFFAVCTQSTTCRPLGSEAKVSIKALKFARCFFRLSQQGRNV